MQFSLLLKFEQIKSILDLIFKVENFAFGSKAAFTYIDDRQV